MASYGSQRSFLLIFSAGDDLVRVSWKLDARKCQNQVTLLSLTSWVKGTSPFCIEQKRFSLLYFGRFREKIATKTSWSGTFFFCSAFRNFVHLALLGLLFILASLVARRSRRFFNQDLYGEQDIQRSTQITLQENIYQETREGSEVSFDKFSSDRYDLESRTEIAKAVEDPPRKASKMIVRNKNCGDRVQKEEEKRVTFREDTL